MHPKVKALPTINYPINKSHIAGTILWVDAILMQARAAASILQSYMHSSHFAFRVYISPLAPLGKKHRLLLKKYINI